MKIAVGCVPTNSVSDLPIGSRRRLLAGFSIGSSRPVEPVFLESANEITRWLCPNNKNVPVSFKQYIRYISFSSRRPLIGSSIPVQKRRANESGVCCTQTTNRTSQIVTHTKIKLLQLNQAADWVERAYRKRRANENRRGLCPYPNFNETHR